MLPAAAAVQEGDALLIGALEVAFRRGDGLGSVGHIDLPRHA
jgi:hypothetical protein